jgi:lysozyme family protein
MADFEQAYPLTMTFEGGYSNDPRDKGGETFMGISRRAHPEAWANGRPSPARCKTIARADYWDRLRLSEIPSQDLAWEVFDFAFNAGDGTAVKALQEACNAIRLDTMPVLAVDGAIGTRTLGAVGRLCNGYEDALYATYLTIRGMHYLRGQAVYRRGWMRRVGAVKRQRAAT